MTTELQCANCGTTNYATSRFCRKCGTRVSLDDALEAPTRDFPENMRAPEPAPVRGRDTSPRGERFMTGTDTPNYVPPRAAPGGPMVGYDPGMPVASTSSLGGRRKRWPLLLALLFVMLLAVGGGIFYAAVVISRHTADKIRFPESGKPTAGAPTTPPTPPTPPTKTTKVPKELEMWRYPDSTVVESMQIPATNGYTMKLTTDDDVDDVVDFYTDVMEKAGYPNPMVKTQGDSVEIIGGLTGGSPKIVKIERSGEQTEIKVVLVPQGGGAGAGAGADDGDGDGDGVGLPPPPGGGHSGHPKVPTPPPAPPTLPPRPG